MSSDPVKPQRPDGGQFSNIKSKWLSRHRTTTSQQTSVYKKTYKRTEMTCETSLERLQPEIVLRILSYVDAGSLLCISLVNRHFNELTNSNTCSAMWYRFYVHERNKKKIANPKNRKIVTPSTVSPQERPKGYWRNMFFREMSGLSGNKWKKKLHRIDPYSGMPCYTEEVLRSLCVSWEITVTDGRGRRSTFKQSHAAFSSTAVFLYWGASNWPSFNQLTSLELHGVLRVPLDCPAAYRPGWKSFMYKILLQGENKELCVTDKLVKLLYIGQGVTLGFWQGGWEIAFVIVNLHTHRLVERSLHASVCPHTAAEVSALFDDVDPEFGLHGYSAYMELHNTEKMIMSARLSQLFCKRDEISDGYLPLQVIGRRNKCLNSQLVSDIKLPWRTEVLHGNIKDCCMMNLTLWDEAEQPFWCVTAPVVIANADEDEVSYDVDGESVSILYHNEEGRVEIWLKRIEERDEYSVDSLVIYISVFKVNEHFGRSY
ncbi:putative F-box only protein 15 [Triplophysa rosa]|uniref:F-box only protein 15 n=1 Tax=Triplophysa rosa TaxID=992332 RepID=A0A9W7WCD6_TRIRA|nr:putative F-box only protein 15 [Triplophysa rosa]